MSTSSAPEPTPGRGRITPSEAWDAFVATLWEWLSGADWFVRLRRLIRRLGPARVVLGLAIALWGAMFVVLTYHKYRYFGSQAYDLGVLDQTVWLMSRGETFNTVRGLEIWGHHGSVGLYAFVPFYWMGAGPALLTVTQAVVLSLGAVPVFRLASRHLRSEWYALVPALAFLTHASPQRWMQEQFHPEVLALTPLLLAYLAATRERWVAFGIWLGLAVSLKEDVALAGVVLGLVLVARGRRRAGWWTAAACAAWFLFVTDVLIPAFSTEGRFYGEFFGALGDDPLQILVNTVRHPGDVIALLNRSDLTGYLRDLGAPFAFVSFFAPVTLLIGLPQILINLLNVHSTSWEPNIHYAAIPLFAFTVAAVEGLGKVRSMVRFRFLLGAMAALALTTAVSLGTSPFSAHYLDGYWRYGPNSKQAVFEHAVSLPGPDDVISATYNLVPYLSHRSRVYMYPNPWIASYWGVQGENQHDPATVEWLVIDLPLVADESRTRLDQLLTAEFEVVYQELDIMVARRISPP